MTVEDEFQEKFLNKRLSHKKWRDNNRDRVRKTGAENMRKWRAANREKNAKTGQEHEARRKELHKLGVFAWVNGRRVKGPNWAEYQNQKLREKYTRDEDYKNKKRQEARNWIERNHRSWLLRQIKLRAKRLGIKFNLTIDDIIIPARCPVLGIVLKRGEGHSCDSSPTVDRVNAKCGYVKGNVAIISRKANSLKGHATAAQHRRIAEWMEEYG